MILLVYLFVEQTMNDEEEGALLRVQNDEHDLKEKIRLVQTQNPGTAQYDKLGYNLEQNQPVKKFLSGCCQKLSKVNFSYAS